MSDRRATPDLENSSKDEVDRSKVAADTKKLRPGRWFSAVQTATLSIATLALLLYGLAASFDRRWAILDRDTIKQGLETTEDQTAGLQVEPTSANIDLTETERKLQDTGPVPSLTLEETVQADSTETHERSAHEPSYDEVLAIMKGHLEVLAESNTSPPARDHAVRCLNSALETFPKMKTELTSHSEQLNVDAQTWLSPNYTTTEEESTGFAVRQFFEQLKSKGVFPEEAEIRQLYQLK